MVGKGDLDHYEAQNVFKLEMSEVWGRGRWGHPETTLGAGRPRACVFPSEELGHIMSSD